MIGVHVYKSIMIILHLNVDDFSLLRKWDIIAFNYVDKSIGLKSLYMIKDHGTTKNDILVMLIILSSSNFSSIAHTTK